MMCQDETKMSVALGFFGRIVTQSTGEHPGRVDLKLRGTMPLVAAVRLWALKEGVSETSTLARLAAIAARGIVSRDEAAALSAGFAHVTFLLLRQQLADYQAGRRVGNHVDPDQLSKWDKDLLRDALRAIEHFRVETRSAFTGAVF
jgi:signal-transduction protein with cAMP-binding, CBS, and nucleotidyltransferase domain